MLDCSPLLYCHPHTLNVLSAHFFKLVF
uniref:Uncharacterized protein n=1 Tax=Anguilla anguilla TaxID=7936 RepID=A0A0E9S062_ANGAN